MLDQTVYSSRDPACKTPFGAVTLGQRVTLTLRPLCREGFAAAVLVAIHEFAGERRELPLSFAGVRGERQLFTLTFAAPDRPELIWYHFRFLRRDGSALLLGKNGWCQGDPESWQLTVYDDTSPTPDWFGRGVTYQIFPDRFRRTAVPDPAGMVGDRKVHQSWEEPVDYLPEDGEIRNRDFYGGNFAGITEKLPYLRDLGVSTLYLCPIFEAASNHRYNTGDYGKPDPMLGTEADFQALCRAAHDLGIRVMLDGVFNHTGDWKSALRLPELSRTMLR